MGAKELIIEGKTALGIELGSTRIKGVLIDYQGNVLAVGIISGHIALRKFMQECVTAITL